MSQPSSDKSNYSQREEAILAAICYGDIFDFPLTRRELVTYLPFEKMTLRVIEDTVSSLVHRAKLADCDGYLFLPGREALVGIRTQRKVWAAEKWELLRSHLPPLLSPRWIKAALLTGSLAAGNTKKCDDVDLLLVLDHRRMWLGYMITRLWARHIKAIEFCPNYAISDRRTSFLFPNLFTAVEWNMSIPLKYSSDLGDLERGNVWFHDFIPNAPTSEEKQVELRQAPRTFGLRLLEWLFFSPLGGLLNQLEYLRLKWRTNGRYMPGPDIYKPHSPLRQYRIFQEWLLHMDRCGLAVPRIRAHFEEKRGELEKEIRDWGQDPHAREPRVVVPKKATSAVN